MSRWGELRSWVPRPVLIGTVIYLVAGAIGMIAYPVATGESLSQIGFPQGRELTQWLVFSGGMAGAVVGSVATVVLTDGEDRTKLKYAVLADILSSIIFFGAILFIAPAVKIIFSYGLSLKSIRLLGLMQFWAFMSLLVAVPTALLSLLYTVWSGSATIAVERTIQRVE